MKKKVSALLLAAVLLLTSCRPAAPNAPSTEAVYALGFGAVSLPLPTDSEQPLYIAGYHNGWEVTDLRDEQTARAVWLEDGTTSALLIVIDCIGLGSQTVAAIRERLSDFTETTGCDSVNVIATHTHAGVDTLGLWGPIGQDGKNDAFMQTLIDGAVEAAELAYADRTSGELRFTETETADLQADSRNPQRFDEMLYQLRFTPHDTEHNGIRLISFAAHAEALRGENTRVSRDYPGVVCDLLSEKTGEDVLYVPGAIGGLIMTPVMITGDFDAEKNLLRTGERIATVAELSPDRTQTLSPSLSVSRVTFETELDNTLFLYYRFLGILQNETRRTLLGDYLLQTELTVLRLGEVAFCLLPGELFPELIDGTGEEDDPRGLAEIAADYGFEKTVIVGLANDEIGYILPPSDFVLDATLPYLREAEGDHYEETNSVGPTVAADLAAALETALEEIKKDG